MSMIGFPLLLIPLAIYNIFAFLMPGVTFTSPVASVTLMSRVQWTATFGDALLALALVLLLLEIVKASRSGTRFLTDHMLSLLVFVAAEAEFLLLAPFGTSTFFLLTVLMAVEFFAGVVLALRNRAPASIGAPAETLRAETTELPHPKFDDREPAKATRLEPVVTKAEVPVAHAPLSEPVSKQHKHAPAVTAASTASEGTDRKIAEWSASDLVSGDDTKPKSDDVKPTGGVAPEPKP